ncbi:hypothetical protein [Xylanimonas sp. McL0601]|uniref:hypothetical protein n=1 Tax=Xylanimonas sp. McL0601 TaxID=3414739 RepID=UPI003CFB3F6F
MTDVEEDGYAAALGNVVVAAATLEKVVAEFLVCLAAEAGEDPDEARKIILGESGGHLVRRLNDRNRPTLAAHVQALTTDRNHLIHGEPWPFYEDGGMTWRQYPRGKNGGEAVSRWTVEQLDQLRSDFYRLRGRLFREIMQYHGGEMPRAFSMAGKPDEPAPASPRTTFTPASQKDVELPHRPPRTPAEYAARKAKPS